MTERVVHPRPETDAGELGLDGWTFAQVPIALITDKAISDGARVLFAYLVWRQGTHRAAWPSMARIAADLGISASTARRRIQELEDRGWLTVEERVGTSNLYMLHAERHGCKNDTPPVTADSSPLSEMTSPPIMTDTQNENQEREKRNDTRDPATPVADATPTSFPAWLSIIRDAKNRIAKLVWMHTELFPDHDPPTYGQMGKTAKLVGGASNLARLLWEASVRPPVGDVLAYVLQVHRGQTKRGNNRRNGSGDEPTLADFEAIAYGESDT